VANRVGSTIANRLSAVLGLSLALSLLGCATATPGFDYSREPDPRQSEYVIGASDVLRVNVWKTPDLSVEVTVRPDGTVTLPLIGDVTAAGRTPSLLRADIKTRMTTFLRDDNQAIEVIVATVNSYRFTVAGNVEHSGLFATKHYVTLTEAIALAGGPNRYADLERVIILRQGQPVARAIPVNLKDVYSGRHPELDLVVVREDRIFVP
jgi:polysaccharide export outer membrane protein